MSIFNVRNTERVGPAVTASESTHPRRPSQPVASRDVTLLEILNLPPHPDETLNLAFRRKERELGEAFARLTPREAFELHRRLCNPRPDDPVAERFSRLVVARRVRLLNFLLDARRRAALAAKR